MAHPESSFVELHVKKFVNGDGSIIKLAVGAKDATYKDYTAYATYDQGSKQRTGGKPEIPFPVDSAFFLSCHRRVNCIHLCIQMGNAAA